MEWSCISSKTLYDALRKVKQSCHCFTEVKMMVALDLIKTFNLLVLIYLSNEVHSF